METLVQQKILSSFTNEVPTESATVQPTNVSISQINAEHMTHQKTLITNDNAYFIRYGGYVSGNLYNAIEVYSTNSLTNEKAEYVFDSIKIAGNNIYLQELKQQTDGRFYGIGNYRSQNVDYYYLIIFNNFIQDGYLKINKYYSKNDMNLAENTGPFLNVAKSDETSDYYINAYNKIIIFKINVLEGNSSSLITIQDNGIISQGTIQTQLNALGNKLILTKLWETDDHKYEYTKAIVNLNSETPETILLNTVYYLELNANENISGARNTPYEIFIPALRNNRITFYNIDLNGGINQVSCPDRVFSSPLNLYGYLTGDYASVTDGSKIYLFYYKRNSLPAELKEFYQGNFIGNYSNIQILSQYNIYTLVGTITGSQQSIVSIKNIYSPNVTSEPYFDYDFCLPYYMNLYSNDNDNTSLIFSRDATARFYSGNQITNTFIVPNYLLNDGNIEKASVYGKTNYLLNNKVEDFEKNKFESLYFNFIYNLNVIDNTNGLNVLNQIGSNKVANGLWKTFDNYDLRLTKARITYEDSSTEIINLNIPTVTGNSVTFNFEVSGNIIKIEYLSNDESVVYATFRTNLTGTNTITQTIRVE
jgi:hypothetical protein